MRQTILKSALAIAAFSISGLSLASSVVAEAEINRRLYPGERHQEVIALQGTTFVKSVDLLSDWWQKRPTEIRVYEANGREKGELIGYQQFLTYDDQLCGSDYKSKCSYPEAPVSKLSVPVNRNASRILVEIEGLLSKPNEFAILDRLEVK